MFTFRTIFSVLGLYHCKKHTTEVLYSFEINKHYYHKVRLTLADEQPSVHILLNISLPCSTNISTTIHCNDGLDDENDGQDDEDDGQDDEDDELEDEDDDKNEMIWMTLIWMIKMMVCIMIQMR